jgi:hypothetical protein
MVTRHRCSPVWRKWYKQGKYVHVPHWCPVHLIHKTDTSFFSNTVSIWEISSTNQRKNMLLVAVSCYCWSGEKTTECNVNSLAVPSCTCFWAEIQGSVSLEYLLQHRNNVCVWNLTELPSPCLSQRNTQLCPWWSQSSAAGRTGSWCYLLSWWLNSCPIH